MANINFSKYQNDIFNFVTNGSGNAVVSAVAGSGKTTTIVEAAKRVNNTSKVAFFAFNKSIANELQDRLKKNTNVVVKTLHAHGFSALRLAYKFVKVLDGNRFKKDLDENIYTYSNAITIDTPYNILAPYKANVFKLLDLCRINLIQSDETDKINDICDFYGIECLSDEKNVVSTLLEKAYTFPQNRYIDFTDMLTLPCVDKMAKKFISKYNFVFIDECQDLSKAQRELMLLSLAKNGRFIAVGDKKQAINGFAGATCDSFDLLENLPNTISLPLSVCYRCGKNIIEEIKYIVPYIEASETNINGEVIETTTLQNVNYGDMILCRTCAPLVPLCMKLWSLKRNAYIKGSDLGDGIINLILRTKARSVTNLLASLDFEVEKLGKFLKSKKVKNIDNNRRMLELKDKISCIESLCANLKTNSVNELIDILKRMFSNNGDSKNMITLSTVHKAKGLESDRCFIIHPEKLPLKREGQKEWEFEQEQNLKYVAYTRAKQVLYIVNGDDKELINSLDNED